MKGRNLKRKYNIGMGTGQYIPTSHNNNTLDDMLYDANLTGVIIEFDPTPQISR